ncbi:MAG: DUF262 domain-containing protein [Methanophagales archaeon]|nr:DUF262 domain-containing protein [Methanophagales archaeon]
MTTEIEAKEVTVGKLYSPDFIFKIPIYQRPLSWGKDNFDQLFEDTFDAMNSNEKQYFLGSIILQEHEHEKNKYYLVDGQQRISALAILMAVIRDSTSNPSLKQKLTSYLYQEEDEFNEIPAEMRIIPWEDLKDVFKKYIYEPEGIQKFMGDFEHKLIKYNDTQDPQYHLYEAISVFIEKLEKKLNEPNDLERFVKYLLKKVYLVYIKTSTFTSAFRLFNVLNSRGLPLNTSDLLKSENIGEIKDESMRLRYAKIWRDIENNLGREELENVIAFIRTIQIKEKAKLSIYEEYRREIFEKGLLKKGTEFIDYVKEITDIYTDKILEGKILGDAGKENEYKNVIALLRRFVPFSDWIPPLIVFYRKFRVDEHLLDFILRLEKKVMIEWVSGFSSTERTTSLNRVIKLIEMEKEPQKVVDELLFYKGEDRFKGRPPRMLNFSNKNQIGSDLIDRLDDSQFYSIYGGKLTKYILLRIDMKYWELENFPGYPGTITVEHILPQTPSKDSEWIEIFSEEERMEWTNKLGNLVLLSGRKNSKAQNYDFNTKKDAYFKGKSTPFRITQIIENEDKWTLEELKARHQKLLKDAKEIFLNY